MAQGPRRREALDAYLIINHEEDARCKDLEWDITRSNPPFEMLAFRPEPRRDGQSQGFHFQHLVQKLQQ